MSSVHIRKWNTIVNFQLFSILSISHCTWKLLFFHVTPMRYISPCLWQRAEDSCRTIRTMSGLRFAIDYSIQLCWQKKKHMKSNCFRSGENDDHSTVNFMFFFLPNWGSYSFIVSIFRVQRSRILAKLRFGKVTQEIGKVIQMLFNSRSMNLLESFARRGAVSAVPENWNKYSWCEF